MHSQLTRALSWLPTIWSYNMWRILRPNCYSFSCKYTFPFTPSITNPPSSTTLGASLFSTMTKSNSIKGKIPTTCKIWGTQRGKEALQSIRQGLVFTGPSYIDTIGRVLVDNLEGGGGMLEVVGTIVSNNGGDTLTQLWMRISKVSCTMKCAFICVKNRQQIYGLKFVCSP